MAICPICATPLQTMRQREGLYYQCESCSGRAATVSQIRHVLGDPIASKILRLIQLSRRTGERLCPFCRAAMLLVRSEQPRLELDACRACNAVWFDSPTYESLPELTLETTNSRTMQATELIALDRLAELKRRMEEERRQPRQRKSTRRKAEPDLDSRNKT